MLIERIAEARMEEETLRNVIFTAEAVADADFTGVELENVRFERCRFESCDFSYSDFYRTQWIGCDFSNCRFLNTNLLECTVRESKGDGAVFSDSRWKRSTITSTSLSYSNFAGALWEDIAFTDCPMTNAYLHAVRLKRVKFQRGSFSGAELFRTILGGTDLSDCAIDGIRVSSSMEELRGVKLNPAQAVDLMPLLGIQLI